MLAGTALTTVAAFMDAQPSGGRIEVKILWAGVASFLFAKTIGLVLLYKMWRAIQGSQARTSPAQAVLLLFVPVVNIYWVFQAYWGWARDYNRFASFWSLRGRRMSEELALLVCAAEFVSSGAACFASALSVPMIMLALAPVIAVASMGVTVAFYWRACDGINAVAAQQADAAA
jgi:hypothetical protein